MVADAWVYKAAGKLIEQHGADAMTEANRLLSLALTRREKGPGFSHGPRALGGRLVASSGERTIALIVAVVAYRAPVGVSQE
jgi:hypothetical protein